MKKRSWNWMVLPKVGLACLLITLLLSSAGCGQQQDDSTDNSSSGNPVTAPVDYLGAVANSKKKAVKTTSLVGVQQAIKMFNVQEGRFPKDLNEIVGPDYLPRLPEVPNGMKFDYNAQTGEIKVIPK